MPFLIGQTLKLFLKILVDVFPKGTSLKKFELKIKSLTKPKRE